MVVAGEVTIVQVLGIKAQLGKPDERGGGFEGDRRKDRDEGQRGNLAGGCRRAAGGESQI